MDDAHFDRTVSKIKREITEDMAAGMVPATVRGFVDLHEYVEANEYAQDEIIELDVDERVAVYNEIDQWLASGAQA